MRQHTFSISGGDARLRIESVEGDLQIIGWERPEITAKTDGRDLQFEQTENAAFTVSTTGDLILYLPPQTRVQAQSIGGDADLRALSAEVEMDAVEGDLQMRNVAAILVRSVGGDLSVRGCTGALTAEGVGGDASLHDVEGDLRLNVGADLYINNARGSISAQAGADAVLYITPAPGSITQVLAGSDILCRLPENANARLTLLGGEDDSVRVNLPGVVYMPGQPLTLGSGSASIHLQAESDISITSRREEWETMADFDPLGREAPFALGDLPGVPPDLNQRIAHQVSARVQEKTERIHRRVDEAVRRAEEKMRSSERRATHAGLSFGRWGVEFGGAPQPPRPPRPPAPPTDPVTDEERLTILKMLQEKKISLADAEKLLTALEGK